MTKKMILSMLALGTASLAGAQASVTYDFDTDQSGSFVTQEFGGPDSTVNFQYDYSTHTQIAPAEDIPIVAAPNSASTTTGVRIDVNETLGAANSITLYPDVSSLDLSNGWILTFDVWANYNGDDGGLAGSTEFWGFGAQADTSGPGIGSDGADGFNYIITGDSGSGNDVRYSSGSPMVNDNDIPNWFGAGTTNNNTNFDQDWLDFFPEVGTAPAAGAGDSGKRWITVQLRVTNSGATRVVRLKKASDAEFTTVSTIGSGDGSGALPCIGYADFFSSLAVPAADNFVVFDNVTVEEIPPTLDASSWELYN